MTQAKGCEGCSQAHDCKHIYERLGNVEGPSVVPKVLMAFVLPIGMFVVGLGLFERWLAHVVAQQYRTLCAAGLAFSVTALLMLGVSIVAKRFDKRRC
jgi:hypothetical protein